MSLRKHRQHSVRNLVNADRFHAAKIDWTFAKKTRTTFDVMSQDHVPVAEWFGEERFS